MADVGFEPAAKLLSSLRDKVRKRGTTDPAVFKDILREELAEIFQTKKTIRAVNPPEVVMMIGVNGVGKTTTIAKLAYRDIMRGKKVLIAAGDTFRAAAIEQLEIWAKRVGAAFYTKGEGADPAACLRGHGQDAHRRLRRPLPGHGRPPAHQGQSDGRAQKNPTRLGQETPRRPPPVGARPRRHHRPERPLPDQAF
jgi:signal recognition particle GTPase